MLPDIHVHRLSCAAADILQRQQGIVGWVHSCYARILNLRTPTGHLMTLQGEGLLQSPMALALAGALERRILQLPVGTLVVQCIPGTPIPPAPLRLICTGAMVWDGRLWPLPGLSPVALCRRAEALTAWIMQHLPEHGLAPLLPTWQGQDQPLSVIARRLDDSLKPLLVAPDLTITAILKRAARVVGLGAGLTPSGDDLLVGLLAVLYTAGQAEVGLSPAVQSRFLQEVQARTSDLSTEFIRCALAGHFAEPLTFLVRSLFTQVPHEWHAYAHALAAVGHSSGVDAMVGMVLGCRLVERMLAYPGG